METVAHRVYTWLKDKEPYASNWVLMYDQAELTLAIEKVHEIVLVNFMQDYGAKMVHPNLLKLYFDFYYTYLDFRMIPYVAVSKELHRFKDAEPQ